MKIKKQFIAENLKDEIPNIMNVEIVDNKIIYDIDYKQKYTKCLWLLGFMSGILIFFIGVCTGLLTIIN